ncbi:3-methyl-2-oxobutanoate hydroxymethyltransferase [Amantichitinum ursilacus]|uniref:3-methyl-2-oxobutanoate hydroxymethyltransferase n=1 Tax=Amantichitinum ursilacus TaxID=857265 RepID=A0A0N0GNY4_9NEIS|nr:3-methyl-2-oxobutanoate hydroxymethyltransferase [Amantichitinum ursilacus]KPC53275.1 3-methyl-2-oxobutanoate hydroxymethyltransferase [Amantichitinum ursilacus]
MKVTVNTLAKMKQDGQKISMLTCYDASFASLLEAAGVEILLIGDSLGNVIQGQTSTLPVTMDDMVYHTRCVARGTRNAMVLSDLSFGASQVSPQKTFENAARLMAAGAEMVKIEGGMVMAETVDFLTTRGIPVCVHIGLQPQSVNIYGGYKVQGKSETEAETLKRDALALQAAGASLVVMEMVASSVGKAVSEALAIPVIGIGAGVDCDGQVLVLHDMLGVYPGKKARFVKNFMHGQTSIQGAVEAYVKAVRASTFPADEHSF